MASWALPALLLLTCSLTRVVASLEVPEGSSAASSLHGGANASDAQQDGGVAASALQGGTEGSASALDSQDAEAAASSLRGSARASDALAALPFPPISPITPISPFPGLPAGGQFVQQRTAIFQSSAAFGGSLAGPDRFLGVNLGLRGVRLSTPAAWFVTPLGQGTFTIQLVTGFGGFAAFLGARFDGQGVELSPFDDGTGRQRWLIGDARGRSGGEPEVTIQVVGGLQSFAFGRFLSAVPLTGQILLRRTSGRSETWLDIPLELR